MTTVKVVATAVCLLALVGATNILTWWGIQRDTPGRPWHWTAVVGCFAYYPWLNRQERLAKDAESAERCAKTERLVADVDARAAKITERAAAADLAARRQAIEQIVTASFRAGYDIARGRSDQTIEPIINWDADKPLIMGYRKAS